MLNLLRAEWRKIGGNRPVMIFMVWIFPIGGILISLLQTLVVASMPERYRNMVGTVRWDEQMIGTWILPGSEFGRLLVLAFASIVIGGEYQWGTWKNVLPRAPRLAVMLSKLATILAYMMLAFLLLSVILALGTVLMAAVGQMPLGPELNASTLGNLLPDYLTQMLMALIAAGLGVCYAAIAAVVSRSVVGGIVVGLLIVTAEVLSLQVLFIIGNWINRPEIIALYQFTPTYNINNASRLLRGGSPFTFAALSEYIAPNTLTQSLLILAVWVAVSLGLALYLFRRQDITS